MTLHPYCYPVSTTRHKYHSTLRAEHNTAQFFRHNAIQHGLYTSLKLFARHTQLKEHHINHKVKVSHFHRCCVCVSNMIIPCQAVVDKAMHNIFPPRKRFPMTDFLHSFVNEYRSYVSCRLKGSDIYRIVKGLALVGTGKVLRLRICIVR